MKVFVLLSWIIGFGLIVGLYSIDADTINSLKKQNENISNEKVSLEKIVEDGKKIIAEKDSVITELNNKLKAKTETVAIPVKINDVKTVEVKKKTDNKVLEGKLKNLMMQKERLQDNASKGVAEQSFYNDLKRDALNIDMEIKRHEASIKRNLTQIANLNKTISKTEKKDSFGKTDSNPFNKVKNVDKQNQKSVESENDGNMSKIITLKTEISDLRTKIDNLEIKKRMLHTSFINKYRHDMKEITNNIETINKELQDANN